MVAVDEVLLAAVDAALVRLTAAFVRLTQEPPPDAAPEEVENEGLWLLLFALACIVGQILFVAALLFLWRMVAQCLTSNSDSDSRPLPAPVTLIRVQRFGSSAFSCGAAEMQGWRGKHEDAHAASFSTAGESSGSFFVLDGHGGDKVARAAAPSLAQKSQALFEAGAGLDGGVPADDAIQDVFAAVDKLLRADPWKPGNNCGATVVGAMACKHGGAYSLKVLSCGDSRSIVLRPPGDDEASARPVPARYPEDAGCDPPALLTWPLLLETIDHKPSDASEQARIRAAGGFVKEVGGVSRVDGRLAVSRSLGNFEHKDAALHPALQKVSGVPDVYELENLQPGSTVVLACDGLWDKMSGPIVAAYVFAKLLRKPDVDLGDLASWLVQKALEAGSRDNVTAMVIRLEPAPSEHRVSQRSSSHEYGNEQSSGDEITNYRKFFQPGALPEQTMRSGLAFLMRCGFRHNGDPVPCNVCGRWFRTMQHPGGAGKVYCSAACLQKAANASDETQVRSGSRSSGLEMVSRGSSGMGP